MNIMRSIKRGQKSNLWICFGRPSHVTPFSRLCASCWISENTNTYVSINSWTHIRLISKVVFLYHLITFISVRVPSIFLQKLIIIVSKMELIFALILLYKYNIEFFFLIMYAFICVYRLFRLSVVLCFGMWWRKVYRKIYFIIFMSLMAVMSVCNGLNTQLVCLNNMGLWPNYFLCWNIFFLFPVEYLFANTQQNRMYTCSTIV